MLKITREQEFIIISADPPEQVRLRYSDGTILPTRTGRTVGSGDARWVVRNATSLTVRVQRFDGQNWVTEAE